MKNLSILNVFLSGAVFLLSSCTASEQPAAPATQSKQQDIQSSEAGKNLFKLHCAACHPDGGNVIKPDKTLHKDTLAANNIKTPEDIIGKMRNPGPGMSMFDKTMIPDNEAEEIAEYILKTF
jgi:mono/diheme cytochrome c family protein